MPPLFVGGGNKLRGTKSFSRSGVAGGNYVRRKGGFFFRKAVTWRRRSAPLRPLPNGSQPAIQSPCCRVWARRGAGVRAPSPPLRHGFCDREDQFPITIQGPNASRPRRLEHFSIRLG